MDVGRRHREGCLNCPRVPRSLPCVDLVRGYRGRGRGSPSTQADALSRRRERDDRRAIRPNGDLAGRNKWMSNPINTGIE